MEKGLKLSAKFDSPLVDDTTYRQLVGNLIYLSVTRLDISLTITTSHTLWQLPRLIIGWKQSVFFIMWRSLQIMDFFTLRVLILDSMGSQIQIKQALLMIKRKLRDTWSVWDTVSSHGPIRSSSQFLSFIEVDYIRSIKVGYEVVWLRQMLGDM